MSIQNIQQSPQDTSNFYLSNIYQTLADPNGSNTPTSAPHSPPPFSPPNHAVWVNALWFLSLIISLTCALLATLLQQWARRYLRITQSRYSPHRRARIRAFFAEGVEKCLLQWTVDALPTLLHISLFLFFAGLVVFLCNVNFTIFKLVLSWVGLCAALYGCFTCMPIFRHDSPYYTPLSLLAWHILTATRFFIYGSLLWFLWPVQDRYRAYYYYFLNLEESCRKSLTRGMQKTAEETALNSLSEIDARTLMWTFDCLDEDHELEQFFSSLPGFRGSKVVDDPLPSLTEEEKSNLSDGLLGLLDRTLSSDLLPAPVKNRRALICMKAIDAKHMPSAVILHAILFKHQHRGMVATAITKILGDCGNNVLYAQFAISKIIATRQPFDDSWYNLASYELGLPETSLRNYEADSLSLLILVHIVQQQFIHFKKPSWKRSDFSFLLAAASNFNVKNTLPELQHSFCALWNQIVNEMQDRNNRLMAPYILGRIRNVYLALHQDTDSAPTQFSTSTGDMDVILGRPSSYPVCNVSDHCSESTPPIHKRVRVSTDLMHAILHNPNTTAFVPSFASPDMPSSSTHAPPLVQESYRIPTTSLSPVTTCPMHGNIDSRATQPFTSSPKSIASAFPVDIAVRHTALCRTPSGDINVISSPSEPVLDAICGLLLFSGCHSTLPHIFIPESPSSILAPAAQGDVSSTAGLSMEEAISYSPLAIREDTLASESADIPPQLPSLPPVTDPAIDGRSKYSLGMEHMEHCPPDAIVVEYTAVSQVPSSPSPTPVLVDVLPHGMLLPVDRLIRRFI